MRTMQGTPQQSGNMAQELKDYKDRVRKVLEEHEDARNNDSVLLARYLNKFRSYLVRRDPDNVAYIQLKDFKEMPAIETLTRARRIIQNDDGEFLPTLKSVRKARKIKEQNYRDCEVREATLL